MNKWTVLGGRMRRASTHEPFRPSSKGPLKACHHYTIAERHPYVPTAQLVSRKREAIWNNLYLKINVGLWSDTSAGSKLTAEYGFSTTWAGVKVDRCHTQRQERAE